MPRAFGPRLWLALSTVLLGAFSCVQTDFAPDVFLCAYPGGKCPSGQACAADGLCRRASCADGVLSPGETDVDCGGACPTCRRGQTCKHDGDCTENSCQLGHCACPTDMVLVTNATSGSCIDAQEVTQRQYLAFLNDANKPPRSSRCSGNTDYQPGTTPACPDIHDENLANHAVVCVDFCDAEAYCTWAGKRLCGGFDGNAAKATDRTNRAADVWMAACDTTGKNDYPYGDSYQPRSCGDVRLAETTACGALDRCCSDLPAAQQTPCVQSAGLHPTANGCAKAYPNYCAGFCREAASCTHGQPASTFAPPVDAAACKTLYEQSCVEPCSALHDCCDKIAGADPQFAVLKGRCDTLAGGDDAACAAATELYCGVDWTAAFVPHEVGAAPACLTANGVYDLTGNAREWEDSCDQNGCVTRGGSFFDAGDTARCDVPSAPIDKATVDSTIGFRCCSQLPLLSRSLRPCGSLPHRQSPIVTAKRKLALRASSSVLS